MTEEKQTTLSEVITSTSEEKKETVVIAQEAPKDPSKKIEATEENKEKSI